MDPTLPILYQWPAATNCESIFPRAVVFHRICNIAQKEIKIVDVGLPASDDKFDQELASRMSQLPALECEGVRKKRSSEIIDYFFTQSLDNRVKQQLVVLNSAHSYIIRQWANECFINSLVFARWQKTENFHRFSNNIQWPKNSNQAPAAILRCREFTLNYLNRTSLSKFSDERFNEMLSSQLWSLNLIFESQTFVEPFTEHPSLSDLYIFMVIQGLLSPDLDESKLIESKYGNIMRWYADVNLATSKN